MEITQVLDLLKTSVDRMSWSDAIEIAQFVGADLKKAYSLYCTVRTYYRLGAEGARCIVKYIRNREPISLFQCPCNETRNLEKACPSPKKQSKYQNYKTKMQSLYQEWKKARAEKMQ